MINYMSRQVEAITGIMIFAFLGFLFEPRMLGAIKYSNQNNLITRAPGKDIYLRELGWYEIKREAENSHNCIFTSAFQLNTFYQKLNSARDVGCYFGIKGKSKGISYQGGSSPNIDLESSFFIHDAIRDNFEFTSTQAPGKFFRYKKATATTVETVVQITAPGGTVVMDPLSVPTNSQPLIGPTTTASVNLAAALEEFSVNVVNNRDMQGTLDLLVDRKVWGALLSYYAYTKVGLWFAFDLPVMRITNKLIPQIIDEVIMEDPELRRAVSMKDLLSGNYQLPADLVGPNNDNPDAQDALLFSKFALKDQIQSGIGDLDITIGYRFLDFEKYDADCYFKLSIPTSEEISPEFLFPPQLGNNGHLAMALGTSCSCDLWSNSVWTIEGLLNCDCTYTFSKIQRRTLTSMVDRGFLLPWDKYVLVQELDTAGPLNPLANILTTDVRVSPGFSTENFLAIGVRGCNVVANLGVTVFARQGEVVVLNKWGGSGLYGRPSIEKYRTTDIFDEADFSFEDIDSSPITQDRVQTIVASTPASISMNFFAQVGYLSLSPQRKPFSACIGFAYEVCNENSALNHFTVWFKLGFAF